MSAELHIQTGVRNTITYLHKVYHTTPFKVANITEDKTQPVLHLMLMSSSPGVLDGDEYRVKIELAENSSLHLHTQSYQRLFNMRDSASQHMEVHMGSGSSFYYIPHPSVPHEASSFLSRSKIFLADRCSLTWGEILTSGRKLSGESFKFFKYHNITEIYKNQKLVTKENLLMQPSAIDASAMGQLEGYTHQATLILLDHYINVEKTITLLHEWLSLSEHICFGISALQLNGVVIRLLGVKAEQLYTLLKDAARLVHTLRDTVDESVANVKATPHGD